MSKYVRHQAAVSRNADNSIEEDHWLKQFQKKLEKGAVQPKAVDDYLFDQMNSIMHGNAKYPSVAAAVKDMQDRSGLTEYLDKVKQSEEEVDETTVTKTASDNNNVIDKETPAEGTPIVIKKFPAIKDTLQNIVNESKGNLSIPAIIDRLKSIHHSDISEGKDWEDEALIIFVSKVNLEEKKNNPHIDNYSNLGRRNDAVYDDVDSSNMDVFNILMPAKY